MLKYDFRKCCLWSVNRKLTNRTSSPVSCCKVGCLLNRPLHAVSSRVLALKAEWVWCEREWVNIKVIWSLLRPTQTPKGAMCISIRHKGWEKVSLFAELAAPLFDVEGWEHVSKYVSRPATRHATTFPLLFFCSGLSFGFNTNFGGKVESKKTKNEESK